MLFVPLTISGKRRKPLRFYGNGNSKTTDHVSVPGLSSEMPPLETWAKLRPRRIPFGKRTEVSMLLRNSTELPRFLIFTRLPAALQTVSPPSFGG